MRRHTEKNYFARRCKRKGIDMTKLELLQNEIDSLKNNFEHDLKLLETKLRDYIDVRKEPYNSEWREEPYDRHDPNG